MNDPPKEDLGIAHRYTAKQRNNCRDTTHPTLTNAVNIADNAPCVEGLSSMPCNLKLMGGKDFDYGTV